jgi:hypothetical protein
LLNPLFTIGFVASVAFIIYAVLFSPKVLPKSLVLFVKKPLESLVKPAVF